MRLALPSDIGRSQIRAWLDVAQDVTEGRLNLVLADKIAPLIPLQLVSLQTDYPSHKIRRTIAFLVESSVSSPKTIHCPNTIDLQLSGAMHISP